MSNAALAYVNLADLATLYATSNLVTTPPATLQNAHVNRRWRGTLGTSEAVWTSYITSFDTVCLFGLNLTSAGTTRIRVSSVDSSGLAGNVYDSGSVIGAVDPNTAAYANLIKLLPTVVSGYVRIDLTEPGASYIEAGRLFVGGRTQFDVNFGWGWTEQWEDMSRETESRGGQTYIDANVSRRKWSLQFGFMNDTEREMVRQLDRINGIKTDFLMIGNPASSNLGRDSIWGRVKQPSPIAQPVGFLNSTSLLSSKQFDIVERL